MAQKFLTSSGEEFLLSDGSVFMVLGDEDVPNNKYERKRVILWFGDQLITGIQLGNQKVTGLYIDTYSDEYLSDTSAVLGAARLGQMILRTRG